MPLYEYQCEACATRFEKIQKFSDPPVETCPSCGGSVRKLISSPAIQFKGSGWYVTDYAAKSGGEASSGDSKPEAGAKSEAGTSTEKSSDKTSTTESKKTDKPKDTKS